ncbi:hypothetical protein TNCV_5014311 [Trichonephila clavipes]|nr:hypothetical protein TNCV_5014311 [Trichonephila clavipes]
MTGYQRGEVIACSQPYAYALDTQCQGLRCDFCFKRCNDLKRCSQCSFAYFCDQNCQLKPSNAEDLHVGERCTLNLLRAETFSHWCGSSEWGLTAMSFDHGSKLRGPSPKALK